ncbi:MAG: hypothetical protein P1U57_12360 [Oleibacter sp.]|nr:hypothetical protein [Thalassolituus sp.]
MKAKAPGTATLMPVKGSTCGLRPNLDEFPEDTGFDFSGAAELIEEELIEPELTEKEEPDSKKAASPEKSAYK